MKRLYGTPVIGDDPSFGQCGDIPFLVWNLIMVNQNDGVKMVRHHHPQRDICIRVMLVDIA